MMIIMTAKIFLRSVKNLIYINCWRYSYLSNILYDPSLRTLNTDDKAKEVVHLFSNFDDVSEATFKLLLVLNFKYVQIK